MKSFARVFFGMALVLAPLASFAEIVESAIYPQFKFDISALLQIGRLKSRDEIAEALTSQHDIKTLELPKDANDKSRTYGPDAWLYFHHPEVQRSRGAYVRIYAPTLIPDPTTPGLSTLSPYSERPHGDRELILYRVNAERSVLLHEFMHYLINEQKRTASGKNKIDWGQSTNEDVYARRDSIKKQPRLTEGLLSEWAETLIIPTERILKEELAINMTLLSHQKDLGLDIWEIQSLLALMANDIERYISRGEKDVKTERVPSEPAVKAMFDRIEKEALERLAKLKASLLADLDSFIVSNPEWELLRKINVREVYLHDARPEAENARARLGLGPETKLDTQLLQDVYHFWARRFHPDHAGKESFQQIRAAYKDLKEWIVDPKGASRKNIRSHFQSLAVRAATLCAVGAAYCAIDADLPWNKNHTNINNDFFWSYLALSAGTALFTRSTNEDMHRNRVNNPLKDGIKSGVFRAVGLATCVELIKFLTR